MTPKEFFNLLMEYPQPARTEVLAELETLTRNYNEEYTTALLSDFEELLNDWKYSKITARLEAEYNENVLAPYYEALHCAEYAIAMGCNDPIEWPGEPAPFTPPPPFHGCYDDTLIFVSPMYEYAVEVLKSKLITEKIKAAYDNPISNKFDAGSRLPEVLTTPEALKIFEQARDLGLIGGEYKWLKGLQLLACFAREMSLKLRLGKGCNSDGTPRISWEHFERLFNIPKGKLRANYSDIQKTGQDPTEIWIIDRIFK